MGVFTYVYEWFVNFETKFIQCHFLQTTGVKVTSKYDVIYGSFLANRENEMEKPTL